MIAIGDPVRAGFVRSLARPGGNITGNTLLGTEMAAKRVQLLKEFVPGVSRVAFLWNPRHHAFCGKMHRFLMCAGYCRLLATELTERQYLHKRIAEDSD